MSTQVQETARYPVLPARKIVLTPGIVAPLEVGRAISLGAVEAALSRDRELVVVPQRDPQVAEPTPAQLHDVGVRAEILQITRHDSRHQTLIVRSGERCRIEAFVPGKPYLQADVAPFASVIPADGESTTAMAAAIKEHMIAILADASDNPAQVRAEIGEIDDPEDLVDLAMAHVELSRDDMVALLLEADVKVRMNRVLPQLERLAEVTRVKASIRTEVLGEEGGEQRERALRDRMRAIRSELGEQDEESDLDEYLDRIADSKMPDEVRTAAKKQVSRMRMAGPASPEHSISRTYLEWLLDVPWGVYTKDTLDVAAARAILDADHTGLEKVKKRILELVAVRKLAPNRKGTILCLVGPPGVGKTSLGRSIATALGRKYVRASLGGVRDDAEIRGHRRTYIGALPGRIVNGLKQAGTMNPVFVLDEIDKLSSGIRGDPASALLEVLDPEQNREFVDHYLEVPVDLSKVLFLATANEVETIPPALMDRLEVIHLPGYTEVEKLAIAKRHLLPRQIAEHGIERGQLVIEDAAIEEIIRAYTREAGVRNLERELAAVCRQAAVMLAAGERNEIRVRREDLSEILGPPRFFSEVAGSTAQVGVAMGLAWTPVGGDILFIESRLMPGRGELSQTGQLGDVMTESVRAALSYLRANSDRLGIDPDRVQRSDIHVHVPSGAIRKDGPSAGLAITTAFASLLADKPVRPDVALTGEITLRGQVLPVGGIKAKLLAAHRGDVRTVVLPERNRKDLHDIPPSVLDDLDLHFVHKIDEALEVALGEPMTHAAHGQAVPIPPVASRRPMTPPPPG